MSLHSVVFVMLPMKTGTTCLFLDVLSFYLQFWRAILQLYLVDSVPGGWATKVTWACSVFGGKAFPNLLLKFS